MNNKFTIKKLVVTFLVILISTYSFMAFAQEKQGGNCTQPKIEIKQIDAQKAVVIKTTVASSEIGQKMGELYGKLFGYLGANNIQPVGPPFSVYYEYNPQGNTVFEVGAPVSSSVQGNDEVKFKEFPAMKVVTTLYIGPYEKMAPTYEMIAKYMKDNGLQSAGASWEVYLTDPQQEKDTNKYQTIIYFPIK